MPCGPILFQVINRSAEVHFAAIRKTPVFLFTHPEISFELLDAKYILVEIRVIKESAKAEIEIERVENFLIIRVYAL
jgi:hypothetical protein